MRSLEAWKKKYERHGEQGLNGFFSPVSQPYETFGELELDLRELVVKTLGANAVGKMRILFQLVVIIGSKRCCVDLVRRNKYYKT